MPPILKTCLQALRHSTAGIAFFGAPSVLSLPLCHLLRTHNRKTPNMIGRGVRWVACACVRPIYSPPVSVYILRTRLDVTTEVSNQVKPQDRRATQGRLVSSLFRLHIIRQEGCSNFFPPLGWIITSLLPSTAVKLFTSLYSHEIFECTTLLLGVSSI